MPCPLRPGSASSHRSPQAVPAPSAPGRYSASRPQKQELPASWDLSEGRSWQPRGARRPGSLHPPRARPTRGVPRRRGGRDSPETGEPRIWPWLRSSPPKRKRLRSPSSRAPTAGAETAAPGSSPSLWAAPPGQAQPLSGRFPLSPKRLAAPLCGSSESPEASEGWAHGTGMGEKEALPENARAGEGAFDSATWPGGGAEGEGGERGRSQGSLHNWAFPMGALPQSAGKHSSGEALKRACCLSYSRLQFRLGR